MSKKWQDQGLTAVVAPVFPHCAFRAEDADDMGLMLEYTLFWNILHYPCGVVPVTRVQQDEEDFSDTYNDGWTKLISKTCKGSAGMPIPVQVVGHTYEDEKVLAVMQSIDKKIGFSMQVSK